MFQAPVRLLPDENPDQVLAVLERKLLDKLRGRAIGQIENLALEQLARAVPNLDFDLGERSAIFAELPVQLARLWPPTAVPQPGAGGDQGHEEESR